MLNRPLDSEPEEIEVTFNSCTPLTFTIHQDLLAQLVDPLNRTTPSVSPIVPHGKDPADYVDIQLTIDAARKINWNYTSVLPDHGFSIVDVIEAADPQVNPLEQLRRDVTAALQAKL